MLIIVLVLAPLSLMGVGFIGLIIVGTWQLVDAFVIRGNRRDFNNRLIACLNV